MAPETLESENVSLVGYHDLEGKPGFKLAIRRVGDRWLLYLAHLFHSGWSVVDVTDPGDPELVRFLPGPDNTMTKQIQVADGKMITSLERPKEDYGVVGGERLDPTEPHKAGVAIWDVASDPTDPQLESEYLVGGRGTHRNFYRGGQYVYLCVSPDGFEPTRSEPTVDPVKNYYLSVLDISDPTDPRAVAEWMLPGQDPDDDVAPETNYFHGPAYVQDDRAYLSYGRAGMVTLDVSDPTAPELIYRMGFGPLGSYNGTHSVVPIPGTDLAAVNSEAVSEETPLERGGDPLQYTFLVDLSDERPPTFEGRTHRGPRVVSAMPMPTPEPGLGYDNYHQKPGWFGPHNQHHPRGEGDRLQSSEYLFVTYFNAGLRVFDISDPLAPREAGYYVPTQPDELIGRRRSNGMQFEDVLVDARGIAYCTDPQRGVYVLETDLL
jgi:hypothetical protein